MSLVVLVQTVKDGVQGLLPQLVVVVFVKTKQLIGPGVGYCPNECRGCAGCPLGSCGNWDTPRAQGQPCALDNDCAGWSLFGDVACCNFHCVTKDETVQTCPSYCNDNPSICSAPYPN